jgi:hypothetical protein
LPITGSAKMPADSSGPSDGPSSISAGIAARGHHERGTLERANPDAERVMRGVKARGGPEEIATGGRHHFALPG